MSYTKFNLTRNEKFGGNRIELPKVDRRVIVEPEFQVTIQSMQGPPRIEKVGSQLRARCLLMDEGLEWSAAEQCWMSRDGSKRGTYERMELTDDQMKGMNHA